MLNETPLTPEQQKLAEDNVALTWYLMGQFKKRYCLQIHDDDLLSAAMKGLVMAARAYDPSLGKFSVYAAKCIKGELFECRREYTTVHVAHHAQKYINNFRRWKAVNVRGSLGDYLESLKTTKNRKDTIRDAILNSESAFLSVERDDGVSQSLYNGNKQIHYNIEMEFLEYARGFLNEIQSKIIYMKFYLDLNFREIGEQIGYTHERTRQIYHTALDKMRRKYAQVA